jgi:hypothetical protein
MQFKMFLIKFRTVCVCMAVLCLCVGGEGSKESPGKGEGSSEGKESKPLRGWTYDTSGLTCAGNLKDPCGPVSLMSYVECSLCCSV